LIKVLTDQQELLSPNTVKVVKNLSGEALYFSRAGIPFLRDTALREWIKNHTFYKHIGVYSYKNKVLQSLTKLSNSSLENAESLEQLRWLENGYNIATIESNYGGIGIDTYSDLLKARELAKANPDLLK